MNINSLSSSLPASFASPLARLRTVYDSYADVIWMIVLTVIALVYALQYNFFFQAIPHDTTFHIYAAQQMLDGHPIYLDVAIIKAPLADFATVLAILFARLIHVSDITGARLMSLIVAVSATSLTYLAGRVLFRSRTVGVLAGLVMAGWNFYALRSVTGPEPKAYLILFSLLAFVLIVQRRWLWAGICASLGTLAWQPGLMLAALALAAALIAPWLDGARGIGIGDRNTTRPSQPIRVALRGALLVIAGLLLPFVLVVLYLGVNHALGAAWNSTIGANVNHLVTTEAKTPLPQMIANNYAAILEDGGQYCFSPQEHWLVFAGILGFLGLIVTQLVMAARARRLPIQLEFTPLILYTLGFAVFSLIDFNFCPDLFPMQPILALMVGWLGWLAVRGAGKLAGRWVSPVRAEWSARVLLAVVIFYVYIWDVSVYTVTGTNFQDQMEVVVAASAYLLPSDQVLSFGDSIVPVTLRLRSSSKILHLGSKSGLGVLSSEPGGIQGMIAALDRDPPKLVTLSRENFPDWANPFYDWLNRRYVEGEKFPRADIRFFILKP